ncbi:MAG: MerC domain-containing protein [Flavobacteriales bacterium]|nr:MerC domain-containing protein [Flavobacteriales bacterium]
MHLEWITYICAVIKRLKLDTLGMGASIICAIHCAAVPFLVSISATVGLDIFQSHWFEFGILGLAFIFIAASLLPSFLKHRNALPLTLATLGLIAVIANHIIWGHSSYILSFSGAIAIANGHYKNYQLMKI